MDAGAADRKAYVALPVPEKQFPGIMGLLNSWPDSGRVLAELAEVLLRQPHSLARGERELIAAYVSGLNSCGYCCSSHSAFAAAQLNGGMSLVEQVHADPHTAPISAKLRSLLRLAAAVRESGRSVTQEIITAARAQGATDSEIQHTVLIAAAFCMFNRYVDGLNAWTPEDPDTFVGMASQIVDHGYRDVLENQSAQRESVRSEDAVRKP